MGTDAHGLTIPNFLGAVNEALDEEMIKINETPKAQNCNVDDGALKNIDGYVKYTNTHLNTPVGTLIPFYLNGVGILLLASNGTLYKLNGANLDVVTTGFSSNEFDYLNFQINNDMLIFGNGVDFTKIYDGTTVRDLRNRTVIRDDDGNVISVKDANNITVANENAVTTLAPMCKYLELHYERIWGAGDSNNPDRVYFSTANSNGFDPEDWTFPTTENEANQHGGFIECPTFDGGKIIGLKVIFDDVLIFKNRTIFKIFGTNPSNYTKIQLFASEGAIADKSIVTGHNKAYFVASNGIFMYDGTNVLPMSEKIKKTWDTLNKNYLDKAVGVFYKNKYILAVPEGNSTKNNLIIEYNTITGAFMFIRGITINSFVEFDNKLLFVNDSGYIYSYGEGTSLDGSVINSVWETGVTNLGYLNAMKDISLVYFNGSGNGSIKLTVITERNPIGNSKIIPLTSTNSPYKISLRGRGRNVKLKIENINGSTFNIKSVRLQLELDYD